MKTAIIFYSRTGNTRHIAKILEEKIKEKKTYVDAIEIKAEKRPNYLKAGFVGMKQKELPIKNMNVDLKKYDGIIIGSPIWSWHICPYLKTFFNQAKNIKGKNAVVYITCGGGIEKQPKAIGPFLEYLKSIDMKPIGASLALQMRKEEIKDGKQNIDGFIEKILSK